MTTYGVTDQGFVRKPFEVLFDEMKTLLLDRIGKDIDLSEESPLGQILAIVSELRESDQETLEAIYYSQYPNTATGASLDNASQATGHRREMATYSTTTLRFTGAVGATIATTDVLKTSTGIQVSPTVAGTIPISGSIDLPAKAVLKGNVQALSDTITQFATPILGVNTVTNLTDLTGGKDEESDQEFRARRILELQQAGTSSIEGIKNAVLNLDYILKCIVVENALSVTDGDGRPPKSIEVYVTTNLAGSIDDAGNEDEKLEVATTIFESKAAGIETHGNIFQEVIDSEGFPHDVEFSEPTKIDIEVEVEIETNTDANEGDVFPADGDDQIKVAITTYGDTLDLGQDVWLNKIMQAISSVAGVKGITSITLNGSASSVVVGRTEISYFDSSLITVTHA